MKCLACLSVLNGFLLCQGAESSFAPAPPPPALDLFPLPYSPTAAGKVHAAATVYSIGDPSPEEQLYLEAINRARANPPAEGVLLGSTQDPQILAEYQAFGIDLSLMRTQFAAISPAQPLAMNASLTTAARGHSQDMFNNVFQDHNSSDGSTPGKRIEAVGYAGQAAENIYSNAKSVAHGHAAFEVDWGGPASNGGMQSPPGHRQNIHNPVFREVGIGVVLGYNSIPGKTPLSQVGPEVVTQDFGVAQNSTPFITGVAYYDLNGNGAYDIGEGIGNVHVTVAGASSEAVTARSGGYAVPVPGNGNYTLTFSGTGFTPFTQTASVVGSKNVKIDFTPAYSAPVITGPTVPAIARSNAYTISPVGGASDYQWHVFQKSSALPEGAENDSARLTISQTGTYDVIEGIIVKSGSFAFHLVTPAESPRSQYITLSPTYLINQNSTLTFQSQLGYTTSDQHAQVQVSTDAGLTWTSVFNQDGSTDASETSWHARTVNLSTYSGKAVRIRFALEFNRGIYVNATDINVGWLIDDIQFTNIQEVTNEVVNGATGNSFTFVPATAGDFVLQARARTGHSYLDWGPAISVQAAPPAGNPQLRLAAAKDSSGQLVLDADLLSGADPSQLTVESSNNLNGGWQVLTATIQNVTATHFRITLAPPSPAATFYRLRSN